MCRKCCVIRARSATRTHVTTHAQTARGSLSISRVTARLTLGREQPSREPSGSHRAETGGVAHAPAPSVTLAKWVSCAAQNAALVVLPIGLQVVGVDRLARKAVADTGSSTNRFRLTPQRSRTSPTTALCRGYPRGVSRSRTKLSSAAPAAAVDSCDRVASSHIVLIVGRRAGVPDRSSNGA